MTAQNTATASSASHRIAVIPGDGIGPEVVAQSQKVLAAVCAPAEIELQETSFPLGAEHWLATGETLPDETLEQLRGYDVGAWGKGNPSRAGGGVPLPPKQTANGVGRP